MIFKNHANKPVEINSHTLEYILRDNQLGLTPVKLRGDRNEHWLQANEPEILRAGFEPQRRWSERRISIPAPEKAMLFSGFKSKPEAERWGLDFAQQWINNGKADLHKPWHAPK